MNNVLVSIGIPAYKSTYLRETIDSILKQTYQNLELIIVNDASPEPIEEIVKNYSDKRIRFYANKTNLGRKDPVANWNKCLSYAKGEYFSLLCDDDIYAPAFIEEMVRMADKYASCNVFKSGVKIIDANGNTIGAFPESPEWETCGDYIKYVSQRKRKQTISEWMFRLSRMEETGGYEPVPLAWGADYISVMKFAACGGIAACSEKLVSFRRSGQNLSTKNDKTVIEKLMGTKIYARKLAFLINDTELLNAEELMPCVEKIKRSEQKATLNSASPSHLWRLRSHIRNLELSRRTWIVILVKKIIKSIVK